MLGCGVELGSGRVLLRVADDAVGSDPVCVVGLGPGLFVWVCEVGLGPGLSVWMCEVGLGPGLLVWMCVWVVVEGC